MNTKDNTKNTVSPTAVPTVALRRGVLLPGTQLTVPVGRSRSLAAIEAAGIGGVVAVAVQRRASVEDPSRADLHDVATMARILNVVDAGERGRRVVLQGEGRVRLRDVGHSDPFLSIDVQPLEPPAQDQEAEVMLSEVRKRIREFAGERGFELADVCGARVGQPHSTRTELTPGELATKRHVEGDEELIALAPQAFGRPSDSLLQHRRGTREVDGDAYDIAV